MQRGEKEAYCGEEKGKSLNRTTANSRRVIPTCKLRRLLASLERQYCSKRKANSLNRHRQSQTSVSGAIRRFREESFELVAYGAFSLCSEGRRHRVPTVVRPPRRQMHWCVLARYEDRVRWSQGILECSLRSESSRSTRMHLGQRKSTALSLALERHANSHDTDPFARARGKFRRSGCPPTAC